MGKHTSGEWKREIGGVSIYREWDRKKWPIATISDYKGLGWHENKICAAREADANTRLIAAAPCMLEALKYALQEIESLPQWPDEVNNARHTIIKALKKAEGGE